MLFDNFLAKKTPMKMKLNARQCLLLHLSALHALGEKLKKRRLEFPCILILILI